MNPKLKMLLDIGPLAAFFVAYRFSGATNDEEKIYIATAAIMASTIISLLITYWIEKKIAIMPLVSGVVITIAGTLTLVLQDGTFFKMKPTLVNLIFAAILLGGVYFKKPFLKYAMGSALTLSEEGWRILSVRWGIFFIFLAGLNEFIWRNFSQDFWSDFKVFGMLTLTIVFTFSQMKLIKKHMKD